MSGGSAMASETASTVAVEDLPRRCKRTRGPDGLTLKQRRFVEAYMGEACGNGVLAARLAGYKGDNNTLHNIASENVRKPTVASAIERLAENDPLIASRKQRQTFWSEVMWDAGAEMKDRLKASELLGRTQADFIERREVAGGVAVKHQHRHRVAVDLSRLSSEELRVLEKVVGGGQRDGSG